MNNHAVDPDTVHVWRGYKAAATPYDKFAQFLGTVFVPACALLQPKAGLTAYVPTMIPQANKPAGVPDQTALMFWWTKEQHDLAFKTVAVRAYTNLHGDAYDTKISSAQHPIPFAGEIKAEQPYYLVPKKADWMVGQVYHFVGARPANQTPADFFAAIAKWTSDYAKRPASRIDAALIVAGNDFVAFWEHGAATGDPYATDIVSLAAPSVDRIAENYVPQAGLWDDWPGIDLAVHSCINVQLMRPSR
jgi:hypothetical protein